MCWRLRRRPSIAANAPRLKCERIAAFTQGVRQNDINEQMHTIARQLRPDEIRLIAEFYGAGAAATPVAER